jgi:hypothetical protein
MAAMGGKRRQQWSIAALCRPLPPLCHRWHFGQNVVVLKSIVWVSTNFLPQFRHCSPPRPYTRSSN